GDEGGTEDTGESSTRTGIEMTAYYYLSDIFTLDAELAWTRAAFDRPVDGSTAIPGAMARVFSAGLNVDLGGGKFANLRLRHFGDYPLDGGERAKGSTVANMRFGYQASPKWSFVLDGLNLFDSSDHDVEYFYESRLANESMPVADHHFHVFEPRTVRFQASYRY
ncbi:MAG: TonB-dependent receptor, partial [Pseudomonadales bacterium]|nr:TonB-dependent receptor [Pseudomonadales bacterium]